MACKNCGHKHSGPCYPNCPECNEVIEVDIPAPGEPSPLAGRIKLRPLPPSGDGVALTSMSHKQARQAGEIDSGVAVRCACGCGRVIPIKPRYATAACRQRASRKRRAK